MKKLLIGLAFVLGFSATTAVAQVEIDIYRRPDARTPIVVPPFAVEDPALSQLAREMAEVITFDLEFTGLVDIIPPTRYPAGFVALSPDIAMLRLEDWRQTGAELFIYGTIGQVGNQVVAQFRLFDLFSLEQLPGMGQELRVERDHARLAAHKYSEEVVRHLDGTPGIGTTEIVFSSGTTGNKEIYVADYDGANARQLTRHGSISILPRLSPDGNQVVYLSYKDRYCFLYIFDRRTGQSTPLSREVGLNSAPAWHPDGQQLALTLSKDGNAEIYLRNADGSNLRRLTNNTTGDTQPTFSPDGSQIAFVSDRGGAGQVWVMNADGSNQRRLSMQGGGSYDPQWSPCGRYIAYTVSQRGRGMQIWVMNADGSNPRPLTQSQGTNSAPTWSPDSRHVMFTSTRGGQPQLWAHTLLTGEERRIPNLNMAEGPFWGPRRE